jgi:hypothetical protein
MAGRDQRYRSSGLSEDHDRKLRGLNVIAGAKPKDVELVCSYGADKMVGHGPGFAEAMRREMPERVDALVDTVVLDEQAIPRSATMVPIARSSPTRSQPREGSRHGRCSCRWHSSEPIGSRNFANGSRPERSSQA